MATKVDSNQLTDYWEDAATQTLPDYSGQTSTGFAQDGNPVTGQKATLPGAAWFNIMAAVRVSVILAAGKTPSNPPDPLQFLEALQSLGWMTSESVKTDVLADESVTTEKLADHVVTIAKIATALLATKSQAEAGTADDVLMTPLRVKQAIEKALEEDLPKASETQLGGVKVTGNEGITINGSGEIAVDFSQMPTDKFEDLLESIRVPIWLTKNKDFYVNPATGVDDADGGYGVTSEKPFKTLKYTLTYVTDTFNTSSYNIFINLASGYYDSNNTSSTSSTLQLPNFQGNGNIYIQNQNKDEKASTIIRYLINGGRAVKYVFRNVTLQPVILSSANVNYNIIYAEKVSIDLFNVDFDFTYVEPAGNGTSSRAMINASNSSMIRVYASNDANFPSGITINYAGTAALVNTISVNGGEFNMTADINITDSLNGGDGSIFAYANMLGVIRKSTSVLTDPGRAPIINISPGVQVQGYRYVASNNSIISTAGEGPGFFPGTVEGRTSTGAQYS